MSAEVAGTHDNDAVVDQSSKSQISLSYSHSYYTEAPRNNTTYVSIVQRQLIKGSN